MTKSSEQQTAPAGGVERTIGLSGAVVTLTGLVVGASIFILPGTLSASTGPAVMLSYLLAAGVALFSCLVAARIGSMFPVSGASFIVISRMLSPFFGFLGVWFMLAGAAVAVAFLAYGIADYTPLLWPGEINRTWVALLLVLGFGFLNAQGARIAVIGQGVMVVMFMLALLIFCTVGLVQIDTHLLIPFAPNGMKPVIAAAVPAFFSFTGFMLIIELGGEIKNPAKTIPRSLLISFIAVLIIYAAVSLTLVGMVPWYEFAQIPAPVGHVAGLLMPAWAAGLIAITAMAAAATSVNGIVLTYSRDIQAMASVGLLPKKLAVVSATKGNPVFAVLVMTGMSGLCVLASGTVTQYASLLVMAVIVLQILLGLSLLQCLSKPQLILQADRPIDGKTGLVFSSMGLILSSCAFLVIAVLDSLETSAIAALYLLSGAGYFVLRGDYLGKHNVSLADRIEARIFSKAP
jgi:APA family basic amino acid/polyamine antiporter